MSEMGSESTALILCENAFYSSCEVNKRPQFCLQKVVVCENDDSMYTTHVVKTFLFYLVF